jgi:putative inorganic carbon (hco3(-)) transporter
VLAWTTFAFGGGYPGTLVLPAVVVVALWAAYRPPVLWRGPLPALDLLLLLPLALATLQMIPLPRTLLGILAPAAAPLASTLYLSGGDGPQPISADLPATAAAALLYLGVLLLFFTARRVFDSGGIRRTARAIAVIGLLLAALALAQDATAGGLMYWRWRPVEEGAPPFGPFVNRNYFATWAIMAVPVCIGYLTAHTSAHHGPPAHANWRRRVVTGIDGRAAVLLSGAALLILALAATLSRSGMLGLVVALLCGGELARRHEGGRLTRAARPAMAVVAAGVLAIFLVATQVGPAAVAARVAGADGAVADRVNIWRDTVPVLRDFWFTGSGMGTYASVMAVYQRSSPGALFNQAHNHYLQVAAEGGILLLVPVLLGIGAFARLAWQRLYADRSGMFWIRAGAASGLAGVAAQSVWETGLTLPANAVMAAILAAIVIHVPTRYGPSGLR